MQQLLDVNHFWCGTLGDDGLAQPDKQSQWFTKNEALDREIGDRFGALHALLLSGQRLPEMESADGLVAAVVVLDQFSRNIYRDTPSMFAADPRALRLTFEALALGYDRTQPAAHRWLLYLPLMHSERLPVQERCVELFERFQQETEARVRESAGFALSYAIAHRDIIRRFGRFPHRNRILGRASSMEEKAFLTQPGSSF